MPFIVSIIGYSNSGKTTLVEKLVPLIRKKGLRVGTVKHSSHGFSIDHPGKDSFRHKASGSEISVLSGPDSVALVRDTKASWGLGKIVKQYLQEMDIVLAEGYKNEEFLKIEIMDKSRNTSEEIGKHHGPVSSKEKNAGERIFSDEDQNLAAIVCDQEVDTKKKHFRRNDIELIGEYIYELYQADRFKSGEDRNIDVKINGKIIALNPFVKDILYQGITGMVGALKKTETMEDIDIRISKK